MRLDLFRKTYDIEAHKLGLCGDPAGPVDYELYNESWYDITSDELADYPDVSPSQDREKYYPVYSYEQVQSVADIISQLFPLIRFTFSEV